MGTNGFENDWTSLSEQEKRRWAFTTVHGDKQIAEALVEWIEEGATIISGERRWFSSHDIDRNAMLGWRQIRSNEDFTRQLWEKE